MTRYLSRFKIAVAAALIVVLVLAVAVLAAPPPGKGNKNGDKSRNGVKSGVPINASAAQYQYGPGGKQYGKHRVAICHKGHTIRVAQPAVKAHLRHGDKLGPC